ncbi:hypothetical protein DPMN_022631 [Dreissena polymorpha]|uniref:Uncharacterized protein n=1 Tax=Dreissena polymorpha TaxID=45954 RepID=A0A9D4NNX6_DREPO|nr:hypothetical protein DPMN_022631 [Dreissena polymorpha]
MGNASTLVLKLKFPAFNKLTIIYRDELHPFIHSNSHLICTYLINFPFRNRHITVADHFVLLVQELHSLIVEVSNKDIIT